jgi:uncharacterized membrane protein YsdA (DUF1294 family)
MQYMHHTIRARSFSVVVPLYVLIFIFLLQQKAYFIFFVLYNFAPIHICILYLISKRSANG